MDVVDGLRSRCLNHWDHQGNDAPIELAEDGWLVGWSAAGPAFAPGASTVHGDGQLICPGETVEQLAVMLEAGWRGALPD